MAASTSKIVFNCFLLFFKCIPYFERFYYKIRPQELNGLWCCCWEFDPGQTKYQVGTMVIKQVNKNIRKEIYSAGAVWIVDGRFENNWLTGTYGYDGKISLTYSDYGQNHDVLKGTWSGRVKLLHGKTGEPIPKTVKNLPFYASRRQYINYGCHIKRFEHGEGICTND